MSQWLKEDFSSFIRKFKDVFSLNNKEQENDDYYTALGGSHYEHKYLGKLINNYTLTLILEKYNSRSSLITEASD